MYEQIDLDIETAYSLGTEIMVGNLKLKDAQEGIRGFVEKRKPVWTHDYKKEEDWCIKKKKIKNMKTTIRIRTAYDGNVRKECKI